MRDGYVEIPVTSRAAQAELERQQARRRAAAQREEEAPAELAPGGDGGGAVGEPEGPLTSLAPPET